MMIGISGVGKTLWSADHTKVFAANNKVCYHSMAKCRRFFVEDKLKRKDTPINVITKLVAENRAEFDQFYQERIRKDFNNSDVVIVDGTNLISEHRDPYLKISEELNFAKVAVVVRADLDLVIRRQAKRRSPIPMTVLQRQIQDFERLVESGILHQEFDAVLYVQSVGTDPRAPVWDEKTK